MPRAGFASAIIDGPTLIVAGGWDGQRAFSDAFACDLSAGQWRPVSLTGDATLERRIMFGHASDGGLIYMHGGTDNEDMAAVKRDLIALDPMAGTLTTISDVHGDGPPGLARHAVAASSGSLWVFGGWDGRTFVADAYRMHLDEARWERLALSSSAAAPHARAHACFVAAQWPFLLLYGGGDAQVDFGDVYALNAETFRWRRLTNASHALSLAACTLLPAGSTGTVSSGDLSSDTLAVHGGFGAAAANPDEEGGRQDALRLLPLAPTRTRKKLHAGAWMTPRAVRSPPAARMGHALHAINSTCLVVFGGSASSVDGGTRHVNDIAIGVPNKKRTGAAGLGSHDGTAQPRSAGGGILDRDEL